MTCFANRLTSFYKWCVTRFGTFCTILKTWKTLMEECYFYLSCRLQPAFLLKVTLLHGCFSRFLNCTNGTKSRKASHIMFQILLITIRSAAPNLARFMFCAMFIFFGFTFCGWIVLGPYHKKVCIVLHSR